MEQFDCFLTQNHSNECILIMPIKEQLGDKQCGPYVQNSRCYHDSSNVRGSKEDTT